MTIKVINNIECWDIKHEAPRILTIQSSDKFNLDDKWVELSVDNHKYRVKAQDLIDATMNSTQVGK